MKTTTFKNIKFFNFSRWFFTSAAMIHKKKCLIVVNNWALKYNVAVLVDIHAAKGSQNGAFHSAPSQIGQANWSKYPENIANTLEVARFLAARYNNSAAFLGIDLLNEPVGVDPSKMKAYYAQAHSVIRATGNTCILVSAPLLYEQEPGKPNNWELLTRPPQYSNAWQDWHLYLIWGFEGKSPEYLMTTGVATIKDSLAKWNGTSILAGECSLAYGSGTKFTYAQLTQGKYLALVSLLLSFHHKFPSFLGRNLFFVPYSLVAVHTWLLVVEPEPPS